MGFTQRASCRPYKNCYRGGSRKKKRGLTIRKSRKSVVNPSVRIFQQSYSYSSNPAAGKPYGHLVRVLYENGKEVRTEADLNKAGKPINNKHNKQTPVKR